MELAQGILEAREDTQQDKYLIFRIGEQAYGIEIGYVTEIIGVQQITEVPEVPLYIRGIIDLRGKIIPVMDMRLRFQMESKEYDERTCIIVIDASLLTFGLIVDSVSEVLSMGDKDIVLPPGLNKGGSKYIKAIGKSNNEVKLILACERLMEEKEMDYLRTAY